MRVLITGSRHWPQPAAVVRALDALLAEHSQLTVVHGACPVGVDATAARWAQAHPDTVTEEPHPADWATHGRAAGPIRNNAMVEAGADLCLAFIHDNSRGASHCATAAEAAGIRTVRHTLPVQNETRVTDPPGTLLGGTHTTGWAGNQVYPGGQVGPRSCRVCRHAVNDVDGRGTHPGCDSTPPVLPAPTEATVMTQPDTNSLLVTALAAAARGWHVFPCVPGATGEKRPAVRDWEPRATTDTDRITRCWESGPYNVGIACGPSGLVVVDLDMPKDAEDLPPAEWVMPGVACGEDVMAVLAERAGQPLPYDTYLVRTGGGGLHAYFAAPDGEPLRNTRGRLGWKIDTRAHGGYVLAAGSVVAGREYTTLFEAPPAPLPSWLNTLLQPAPVPPPREVSVDTSRVGAYVAAAVRDEAAQVANAARGDHNNRLYSAAIVLGQLVGGGALDEVTAHNALTAAAHQRITTAGCDCTEAGVAATIRSGLTAGARSPRKVAA